MLCLFITYAIKSILCVHQLLADFAMLDKLRNIRTPFARSVVGGIALVGMLGIASVGVAYVQMRHHDRKHSTLEDALDMPFNWRPATNHKPTRTHSEDGDTSGKGTTTPSTGKSDAVRVVGDGRNPMR